MKKILIVCDKPNWAFDSIAKALLKYNNRPDLSLELFYMKGGDDLSSVCNHYDLVFVMGWHLAGTLTWWGVKDNMPFLDMSKTITGLHSHHSWDKRGTMPERDVRPPRKLVRFLNRFKAVNAVSFKLFRLFADAGVKNIVYTPNGVDVNVFRPLKPIGANGTLKVGYSGSLKHDWRKGITECIEPACKATGVELLKAMPTDDHYVTVDEMPAFYNEIDAYLCASSSEGFSLSVLEAASCGRPVISTRVGGCEDLIENAGNGFLVDRNIDAIAEKLELLKKDHNLLLEMGERMRKSIEDKWSWEIRTKDWLDFISGNIQH